MRLTIQTLEGHLLFRSKEVVILVPNKDDHLLTYSAVAYSISCRLQVMCVLRHNTFLGTTVTVMRDGQFALPDQSPEMQSIRNALKGGYGRDTHTAREARGWMLQELGD